MIIRPAYYFETSGVPVFQPTYEEFKDFYTFIQSVEKYGMKAGLIKVIPPQEWLDSNKASPELIKKFTIKKPIKQVFNCGGLPAGAHRQLNMETKKSYTIQDWFDITETDFKPPIMTDLGKMVLPAQIKKRKHKAVQEDESITSKKTALEPSVEDKSSGNEINMENHDIVPISEIPNVPIVKEEYLTQNPAFISKFASKPSLEYLAALERFYWRNLSFQPTMYGADLLGTLFQENPDNKWNVAHLENLLSKVAINVPGVTKPYLYFGMYKATFAWHVEDMDLFSINYIHFGAPKQWYVIPPAHRSRFERFAKGTFFNEAHECPDFLRHKNCVISPSVVSAQNIPVHKLVQFANEFVITFPSAYHQGYNTEFNCAESINFATPSWIEFGKNATFCQCEDDTVQLDVYGIFCPGERPKNQVVPQIQPPLKKLSKKLTKPLIKLPAKPPAEKLPRVKCAFCPLGHTPEFPLLPTDIPQTFAHLECGSYITETWIEKVSEGSMDQLDGLDSLSDQALAVKSSPDADEQPNTVEGVDNTLPPNEVLDTAVGLILNDIVSTVCLHSLQTDGKPESMPALSSDSVVNEAAEIVLKEAILSTVDIQPTTSSEESEKQIQDSMNTNNAAKPNTANCKNDSTFPEIILKPEDSFLSMYKVAGVKGVPKERYRLKCSVCLWKGPSKPNPVLGACIQCTKGKCVRAFHVTCAIKAGIHISLDDNGVMECFCVAHNPVLSEQKKQSQTAQKLQEASLKFPVGTMVIAKVESVTYEGVVVETVPEKNGCMVQFEAQEDSTFTSWLALKVKPEEKIKEKRIPIYTDSRPRKKKQTINMIFQTLGIDIPNPAGLDLSKSEPQVSEVESVQNLRLEVPEPQLHISKEDYNENSSLNLVPSTPTVE